MENSLIFILAEQQFAFDLATVERVIRAVEITPLPNTDMDIAGVMNFHGKIIPVFNMRRVFNLPERAIELEDQFIICHVKSHLIALWVDHVKGVISSNEEEGMASQEVLPGTSHIDYVAKDNENLIFIFNIDKILSLPEIKTQTNMVS